MDIKQLRALLTVAEVGSVTRAADILNVVQPAISRQLRLLEEDLDTELFERSRQGMVLTEHGQILADYARRALDELERARAEIQPAAGALNGTVTLGLLPSTAELLCPKLLSAIRAAQPGIALRFSTGYAGHLLQWLENGEVDATLLYDQPSSATIATQPLFAERLWLVGPASADLHPDRDVPLASLHGLPLILPSAPHGLRGLVDAAAAELGLTLTLVAETNSMRVQRSLVLAGHGYGILPAIAVTDDLARGIVSAAPLTQPELQRKIVLAKSASRRTTAATRYVLETLDHIIRSEWARPGL